jgi:hypothetical protein
MVDEMKRLLCLGLMGAVLSACSDASPSVSSSDVSDEPTVFLAVRSGGPSGDQALYRGPLTVRDGCVLIGRGPSYSLPVWPKGTIAERDSSGRLVISSADGKALATEGDAVAMGGGFTAEFEPADKVEPRREQLRRVEEWLGYAIPERCVGPDVYGLWVVGEMVT